MDSFEFSWSVRGYHVYKEIWEAELSEILECVRETNNKTDRYAVAVKKNGNNSWPHSKISRICSLFLKHQSSRISCKVTGTWQPSSELPQGSLEIHVYIHFMEGKKTLPK